MDEQVYGWMDGHTIDIKCGVETLSCSFIPGIQQALLKAIHIFINVE